MPKSRFLQTCTERGFIHQCTDTDALDALLSDSEKVSTPVICYIGFDCTAPSLHVGSLIQIMILRHFQQAGHKPIVLMGGGTTKVGDPSGKDESRKMLDNETIDANMQGIKGIFAQFLSMEDSFDPQSSNAYMANNDEWLSQLNYIELLHYVGNHFSINRMLSMESVKQRLDREHEMSFLEFNYMIMQAFDFHILHTMFDCRLQIGGSDQWGNIVQGVDLNRRLHAIDTKYVFDKTAQRLRATETKDDKANHQLYGLTTPLLTTAAGAKMGKTADGAVWLNADLYSAYDYWQFWRNVEDADVGRFLRLFTELPLPVIEELESFTDARINEAKKILATEATALLHGRDAAEQAEETARQTFEQGMTAATLPEVTVALSELGESIPAFKLFHLAGLASSGKEARRLIQGGGARINDQQIDDENTEINVAKELQPDAVKLSAGKKKHILFKVA